MVKSMPRKPTGKPEGRPLIPINWELVDRMMMAGSPGTEIAGELGVCAETFYERYHMEKGSSFSLDRARRDSAGCGRLRLRQFTSALQGNTRMMDKLGDERLGQGKKQDSLPPLDEKLDLTIDLLNQNKLLSNQLKELQEKLNATQPQADPVLPGSNQTV